MANTAWCGEHQYYYEREWGCFYCKQARNPAPHAAAPLQAGHTMTGSTLYLIERDQWKERALAAESKLDTYRNALEWIEKYAATTGEAHAKAREALK